MIRRKIRALSGLVLMVLFSPAASLGQEASSQDIEELKKEIQALKAGQRSIQLQLQQISNLLRNTRAKPAPPKEFTLNVGKRPFKGDEAAGLTLVEFSDYQ
jgi:hypothetical protein